MSLNSLFNGQCNDQLNEQTINGMLILLCPPSESNSLITEVTLSSSYVIPNAIEYLTS